VCSFTSKVIQFLIQSNKVKLTTVVKAGGPRRRRAKQIKTLGWIPLPDNKIESTFWKEGSNQDLKSMVDNDFEELFAIKPSLSRSKNKNKLTTLPPANSMKQINTQKSLLSIQRANNIAIVVSSFKMTIPELMECICCFDDKVLTVEKLKQLRSILPTEEEIKVYFACLLIKFPQIIKSFTGDITLLGKSEQFINECSKIPHLSEMLEFFQLKQQFEDIMQDISIVLVMSL
jgi:diaphanous 1